MAVFPPVCKRHESHTEGCMFCEPFDKACTEYLSTYTPPPHTHIAVIRPRVEAWMQGIFEPCDT